MFVEQHCNNCRFHVQSGEDIYCDRYGRRLNIKIFPQDIDCTEWEQETKEMIEITGSNKGDRSDAYSKLISSMHEMMEYTGADFISVNISTKDHRLVTVTIQENGDEDE